MDQVAQLIVTLFHAGTAAHVLHLQTRSYAAHKALDDFYHGIIDAADAIAEVWQGKYGIIDAYPDGYTNPGSDPVAFLETLNAYVAEQRAAIAQDSEIQNLVDEAVALVDSTIYKVKYLS
jgi:hypothetical protein